MKFIGLFLVAFNLHFTTSILITDENLKLSDCTKYKNDLALLASNVTLCFIHFSQPLRLCEQCLLPYDEFKNKYQELVNKSDQVSDYCKTQLLYSDIISIISEVWTKFESQWSEANCKKCFSSETKLRNIDFKNFLIKEDAAMGCLSQYTNADLWYRNASFEADWHNKNFSQEACSQCKNEYSDVNKFYTKLESGMSHEDRDKLWRGLCGDMGEMMNMTRFLWSKKFNCNYREIEWYWAISPILTITAMLFIFYCVVSTYFHNRINMILYKQRRLRPLIEASG